MPVKKVRKQTYDPNKVKRGLGGPASADGTSEAMIWVLEGIVLIGLFCMFLEDNKGLWVRPRSLGPTDDSHREIRSGGQR
jgi:hypothetical protein